MAHALSHDTKGRKMPNFPESDFENVITDIPNLTVVVSRFEADSLDITIVDRKSVV